MDPVGLVDSWVWWGCWSGGPWAWWDRGSGGPVGLVGPWVNFKGSDMPRCPWSSFAFYGLDQEVSLREGKVLFWAKFVSFPNLILVWFACYLDTAPVLWQGHIGRVCPRFVRNGREEPELSKRGFSIGDALQYIDVTHFRIVSLPTV